MRPRTNHHHDARLLTAAALVLALAACSDDSGKFDLDRYREQDQGAVVDEPTTVSPPADDAADETRSSEPIDRADADADPDVDGALDDGDADGELDDDAHGDVDGALDDDELAGLLWMREEEQLAHDVYVALGAEWGVRVFENIAASEQQHIDITIGLLDRYAISDPARDNPFGTFTDPRIQDLYDELLARGLTSREEALAVGATIEELDIDDLRTRAATTDEAALDDAYARLERASRNHLRAFVGQLELLGVEYEPTVLADFDEIVAAPMEHGRDDR